MTFSDAVKTCLVDKYATFSGRATRSEYWYLILFYHLFAFCIGFIIGFAEYDYSVTIIGIIVFILLSLGSEFGYS